MSILKDSRMLYVNGQTFFFFFFYIPNTLYFICFVIYVVRLLFKVILVYRFLLWLDCMIFIYVIYILFAIA